MKRGEWNADNMLCEVCGTSDLPYGALIKILKDSTAWLSRVLIRLLFLAKRQAPVDFEVYHLSTHPMIFVFSLGSLTCLHRPRSRSAWQRLRQSSVFPFMKSA